MGLSISGGVSLPGQLSFYSPPPPPSGYELWAWGNGGNGQLGQGDAISTSSPVQIAGTDWSSKIRKDPGNYGPHTIKTDGTLWAWGASNNGVLGNGTDTGYNESSPIQISALTDWASIGSGQFASMIIKTDGSLWTWGKNQFGQLGFGDVIYRSSPVQLGSLTDWASTTGGQYQSHGIKTDGTLWTWGRNGAGQLGLGDKNDRSSPVQLGGLSNWAIVKAGLNHTLAIKTDGTLWAWGNNNYGALAVSGARSSPIQIGALTDWASIGASRGSSHGIKTDGTLWAWGGNTGQQPGALGLGDVENRQSPTQVGSLTDWATVLGGRNTTLARRTNGTIWSWGNGAQGRTGLGDEVNRSSPTQIGTDTNWVDIGSGGSHFLALKSI